MGCGCSICAGKRILIGFNDLGTTYPIIASEWHSTLNGAETPQMVMAGSDKVRWWVCALGHAYDMPVDHRTRLENGCYYCSGHRVLVGFNDVATTHPTLCEEWHPTKNTQTPQDLSAGSGVAVWWLCPTCKHEWPATITSRSTPGKGRARPAGCPECKWSTWGTSKTEDDLFAAMVQVIPDLVSSAALARSPEHAAKRKTWRVDLFSPSLNLVVEYDGELWHLPAVFPGGLEAGLAGERRDHAKTGDLLAQGYRVVRVRTGRLAKITEDDLWVHTQTSGALVAVALLEHLSGLGLLVRPAA